MTQREVYIDLLFTMRGGASAPASMGNYAYVALFNDSHGDSAIALWWAMLTDNGNNFGNAYVTNSQIGSGPTRGIPVVTTDAPRAGLVSTGALAALPGQGDWMGFLVSPFLSPIVGAPLAVLQPGWSFAVVDQTISVGCNVSFYWSTVSADWLARSSAR